MKTARFFKDGRIHSGVLEGGLVHDEAGEGFEPDSLEFLLPFQPGKVVGLALNYADHADELGLERPKEPVTFIKPNSSLIPHGAPVVYPAGAEYMHYECELAVVIGRGARKVGAGQAMEHVMGYTVANDITVRDFVGNMFRPPLKAKGWDTFGPMGPYLVTADEVEDPHALELTTHVNGELRQEGSTRNLVFTLPEIIEFLTRFLTLEPFDVILTGTPKGLSHVHPGDVMRLEVTGLGVLENPVIAEAS